MCTETTLEVIKKVMVENGWVLTVGPSLAVKIYQTAVGNKQASAWFKPCRSTSVQAVLSAYYESEGRNVAESSSELIWCNASEQDFVAAARSFAAGVDQAVWNSYACRLHRNRNASAEAL